MDKALFRAYVKELVKESVKEEVQKILPKLLEEAVTEIKSLQESASPAQEKQKFSRAQLAQMMGLERHGDTIVATTGKVMAAPKGVTEDNPVMTAINRDYSKLMKAMGLSK